MNITAKRSLFTTIIFGVLYSFLLIYFMIVGADEFIARKVHQVVSASVFMICFLSFLVMLLLTNKKTNIVDERDTSIQRRANSAGLLMSLVYVFLVSITLFVIYRNDLMISVSWMWFIAYTTFAFGYFITSAITLFLHIKED